MGSEERTLKELLAENYSHVYGFLLKMTQDVMVKAILRIKQFRGKPGGGGYREGSERQAAKASASHA